MFDSELFQPDGAIWIIRRGLVQAFFLQKLVHQICDFEIIQIREWKVSVAANAYLGQMHYGDITTSTVYSIPP